MDYVTTYDFGFISGEIVLVIIELTFFYAITNTNFQKKDILFGLEILLCGVITSSDLLHIPQGLSSILWASLTILSYYYYFRRKVGSLLVLAAITLIRSVLILNSLIWGLLLTTLPIDVALLCLPITLLCLYVIFMKFRQYIHRFLIDENHKTADWLVIYLYVCALILDLTCTYGISAHSESLFFLIMLVQSIFIIAVYVSSVNIQKKLLKRQEQENLKVYLHSLEKSEDRVRKFKHDYLNLLSTLRTMAVVNNDQKLIQELEQYSSKQINEESMWRFKDVNHLRNNALKSLVINKLNKISELGVKYSFECEKEIETLPDQVKLFDLLRIIGIVFDNTIEASQAMKKENAEIKVMFYQEKPGELEFKIQNKCQQVDMNQVNKKGYTTKEGHYGLGLVTAQEINDSYSNMFIEYSNKDGWFSFTLVII